MLKRDKVKLTFAVPEQLGKELREVIVSSGYGLRSKSKWVSEALESFLQLKDFYKLAELNEAASKLSCSESVTVSIALQQQLKGAILEVRQHCPTLEGVQSKLLRACIMHRIIKHGV